MERWLRVLGWLAVVAVPLWVGAQTQGPCNQTLQLRLEAAEDHAPLAGVAVHQHYEDGSENLFLTNEDGWVTLPICRLPFRLHVDCLGYVSVDTLITTVRRPQLVLFLRPAPILASEVVVESQRTTPPTAATATLAGASLQDRQGGTLTDALVALPGVSSFSTGPTIAKPVVHGHQGTRVVILNNGVRQEAQQWGSEHGPEIDPFLATALTVVKGPSALRFGGDAIGGVVLVEPPQLPTGTAVGGRLQLLGATNGQLVAASALVQGGVKGLPGWAWRVQGTLRSAGDLQAPDYYLNNTGLREANFSLATGYVGRNWRTELFYSRFSSRIGILGAAHIGNLTDLSASIQRGAPVVTAGYSRSVERPYQQIDHQLLKSTTETNLGTFGTLQVVYAWQQNQREEYDLHRQNQRDVPALSFTINTHTVDVRLKATEQAAAGGRLAWEVGATGFRQHNTWEGRFLVPFYIRYGVGGYSYARWERKKSALVAGVRYEYQRMTAKFNDDGLVTEDPRTFQPLTGGLSWAYDVAPGIQVEPAVGWAVRTPYANELYSDGVHHGSGTYEVGDSTLGVEQALKTALSFRLRPPGAGASKLRQAVSVDVQLYRDQVFDYIVLEGLPESVLTIRGAFPAFGYSQSDVTFYGADLSLTASLTPAVVYTLRASWVRSEDESTGYAAPFTPADRYQQSLRYTVQKTALLHDVYLEVSSLAVARTQGFAPTEGLTPATPAFITQTRDYAPPPPGYAIWSVAVGGPLHLGKAGLVEVRLSVENVLDTTYRDYLDRFRYFVVAPGRNLRLQLRIPFGQI